MDSLIQLKKHLYELETELQQRDVRTNFAKLDELIDDEFFEHGASGKVWTKEDVFNALQSESFAMREISYFKVKLLSQDIVLVTYRCHHHATENTPPSDSLRSSIWKSTSGQWRIVFHQGTTLQSE